MKISSKIKTKLQVNGNTRWFKYDRDKLWLVYTQSVPVIFEPPCIIEETENFQYLYSLVTIDGGAEEDVKNRIS
jgi:hypothetical protein